ncbi:MAG: retropepsin-like aspartic protease, partial [Candidatus Bathyarchaeia archaeon]
DGGPIVVNVTVMNPLDLSLKAKLPFIADSGASVTTIPERVAEELKLRPRGEADVEVADGRVVKMKLTSALLRIGGKEIVAYIFYGPNFDALLGLDVMEPLKIHIDVADRSLLIPLMVMKVLAIRLYDSGVKMG